MHNQLAPVLTIPGLSEGSTKRISQNNQITFSFCVENNKVYCMYLILEELKTAEDGR